MAHPTLPDLNPSLYRWHPAPSPSPSTTTSSPTPRAVQRLANGTEAWVGIKSENAKGQYDFYLAATLRTHSASASLSLSEWAAKFALALVQVRHAEILCEAVWPDDGGVTPWIKYVPPANGGEALERTRKMVEVRVGGIGALGLREVLGRERMGAKGDGPSGSVRVYLIGDVRDEKTPVGDGGKVEVLVRFNHVFWDGISARMLLGEVLVRLGEVVGMDEEEVLAAEEERWTGSEWKGMGLSEPILDACGVDVEGLNDDEEFERERDEFIGALLRSGTSWGLPVTNGEGVPRTGWFDFTKAQSDAIIRAVKTRIGRQYTISHLGHAATVLALLRARPVPVDDTTTALITALPVNGRSYLRKELAEANFLQDKHAVVQYGACQAGAVVEFPHLAQWVVDETDSAAVKTALEGLIRHIKTSYDYWTSKPYLLPMGVSKDNFLSAFLSSAPTSVNTSSVPIFVTDGVVDRYVPGEVRDPSGDVMMIEECRFLLDLYNSGLIIRMESFKGATSLSFCYNDGHFRAEDAKRFLEDMAGSMLAFAE